MNAIYYAVPIVLYVLGGYFFLWALLRAAAKPVPPQLNSVDHAKGKHNAIHQDGNAA